MRFSDFVDEVGQKTIEDSGSNANGSWVKFGDGTMICWGTASFTTSMSPPSGSSISNTGNLGIDLPQTFTITPKAFFQVTGESTVPNAFILSANSPNTTTIVRMRLASILPRDTETFYVDWRAIGRWK